MNFNLSVVDESNAPLIVDVISINGNDTLTASSAIEVITDNSSFDISITLANYHTYTNTVTVYTEDETVTITLFPIITDVNDPNYRRPYPSFFTIIEPCSYNVHLYNASSHPFGVITYEENGTEFSSGNTNTVFTTCEPDVLSFTQVVTVRQIPNCGGTSPVIWTEETTPQSVTVTEYKPELTLNRAFDCCETIDEAISIYPTSIELQAGTIHDACDIATVATDILEYIVTDPSGVETTTTYTGIEVEAGPLANLGFTYTPTELGTYTLQVNITNCCTTTTYNYSFDVCNSWVVTNTDCNVIRIQNLSDSSTITYTIKKLTNYSTFENVTNQVAIVVPVSQYVDVDLVEDNLYTITVTDSYPSTNDIEQIFLLDCGIKTCKKQMLLDLLCSNIDKCDAQALLELRTEFAEFKALEEIVYQKWDEWKLQQSIVDTFSINDIMSDAITLSKAIGAMKKICDTCTNLEDEDCGCN